MPPNTPVESIRVTLHYEVDGGEKAVTEHVVLINRPGPAEHRTHNTAGVRFRPIGVEGPLDVAAEIYIEAS